MRSANSPAQPSEDHAASPADVPLRTQVKPGMPYLDIIKLLKDNTNLPISAYHVSGEYAMLKAAAERGWGERARRCVGDAAVLQARGRRRDPHILRQAGGALAERVECGRVRARVGAQKNSHVQYKVVYWLRGGTPHGPVCALDAQHVGH